MEKFDVDDKVFIIPLPPPVGVITRVWEDEDYVEITWPSGYRSLVHTNRIKHREEVNNGQEKSATQKGCDPEGPE